jgi:outer membrane protein W
VPFTATFRYLPLGRSSAVQPYFGAGVGLFRWRYSESGEFVDFDSTIFRETYIGSGGAAGPVVLGGLRFPVGAWDVGGEIRYQNAEGTLPTDQGFSADKIDLGGFNYLVTFNVRF